MSTDAVPQHGAATPDPSMDDILASIRRILDEEGQRQEPEVAAPAESPGDDEEILDLDQFMVPHEPDLATPGPVPAPPPILAEPVSVTAILPAPDQVPMASPPYMPALVAPAAAAAAAVSVNALMRTLASERSTAVHRGGPTIEDLVREEIRPILKEWLDAHLPPLVERLVRAEIERVVSRMT